ncbi:MAG: YlxR family protein [Armatimonadetes bacterium]|nr:YlxR family protein [Armatimonadota bacterium]
MPEQRKVPIRTCVSCRESSEKKTLLRIVCGKDGLVRVDTSGKISGRGAYLCGSAKCLRIALKANKLGRALRCEIPEELKNELEKYVAVKASGNQGNGNEGHL